MTSLRQWGEMGRSAGQKDCKFQTFQTYVVHLSDVERKQKTPLSLAAVGAPSM